VCSWSKKIEKFWKTNVRTKIEKTISFFLELFSSGLHLLFFPDELAIKISHSSKKNNNNNKISYHIPSSPPST
jgi:hypothetical protein